MSTRKYETKTSSSSLSNKKTTKPSTKTKESADKKPTKEEEKKMKQKSSRDVSKTRSTSKEKLPIRTTQNVSTTLKKSSRQNITTPPSNRVMKTQYFPSKDLYSNALKVGDTSSRTTGSNKESSRGELKENVKKPKIQHEEKKKVKEKVKAKPKEATEKPKPLTLAEVKKKMRQQAAARKKNEEGFIDISPDTSSISERPRTATLRKGSIVNANIVGPDAPKKVITKPIVKPKSPSPPKSPDEYAYDEDFESYESDFEAYSSSQSSEANISGEETSSENSESPEVILKTPDKKIVQVTEPEDEKKLDSGNYELPDFKHKQILGNIQEIIEKENSNLEIRANPASLSDEGFEEQKSLQFINFLDAKKKCDRRKNSAMKRKRGEEILSMIRLDTINFIIFDLPSVPYEVFIKIFGSTNTMQTFVQTGEDDICEETQTEEVEASNKWTQFPAKFTEINEKEENFWGVYKCNYLGVGGDNFSKTNRDDFNENNLNKFLSKTGDLISDILAEENIENLQNINKNKRDIPFSDGYLTFNTNLDHCCVSCVSICNKNKNKILTVHTKKEIDDSEIWKSIICLWDIGNLDQPQSELISYGEVSCCCFCVDLSQIVLAGQTNGTICIWNMSENIKTYNISNATPCVITKLSEGHTSKIVSIECYLDESQDKIGQFQTNRNNISVCSLSEDCELILWTLHLKTTEINSVILVQNSKICLQENIPELPDLQCTGLILDSVNGNFVYVATNYGFILYCLLGDKSSLKKYVPESPCEANCIECCPFSPKYFFCGYINGDISLYSKSVKKPLIVLSNKEGKNNNSIDLLQWSRSRPFVLYAKDSTNTINVWNLGESDIFPIYSVPFSETITCLRLSPFEDFEINGVKQNSYMIVGTECGKVFLHLLNQEHGQQSQEFYGGQVDTFFDYVNRL